MKKLLLTFQLLLFIIHVNAQSPGWEWITGGGGSNNEVINASAVDASGNTYVTGYFQSATLTIGSTTLLTPGFFLAKYNASGNVVWAKGVDGGSGGKGKGIATDANGNVYVTGNYNSAFTLGTNQLTAATSNYGKTFIAKYNANGSVAWAMNITGNPDNGGNAIDVDPSGNIFVTGWLGIGGSGITIGTTNLLNYGSISEMLDFYIAKFDNSGNALWAKKGGMGLQSDKSIDVHADGNGDVYLTGWFETDPITFGSYTFQLTDGGVPDAYLVKYSAANGTVLWAKHIHGYSRCEGNSIATDASNNVILGSTFFGNYAFVENDTIIVANDYDNTLVTKYNSAGTLQWVRADGGEGVSRVACDANGNIFVTGPFTGTINFGSSTITNSTNNDDIYILKYSAAGNPLWAKGEGSNGEDASTGLAVNSNGNLILAGHYDGDSIYLGTEGIVNANNDYFDFFISKMCNVEAPIVSASGPTTFCSGDSILLTASSGANYLWSTGATTQSIYVSEEGSYHVTVDVSGCSAISATTVIELIPGPPTPIIAAIGNLLTSSSSVNNQWYFNGQPISGATNQTYTFNSNQYGSYTVVVTGSNGCSSESDPFLLVGIESPANESAIHIYPNPTQNYIAIESKITKGTYQLQDITGKVLLSGSVTATKFSLDISALSKGIYLLSLIDGEQQVNRKVVKE